MNCCIEKIVVPLLILSRHVDLPILTYFHRMFLNTMFHPSSSSDVKIYFFILAELPSETTINTRDSVILKKLSQAKLNKEFQASPKDSVELKKESIELKESNLDGRRKPLKLTLTRSSVDILRETKKILEGSTQICVKRSERDSASKSFKEGSKSSKQSSRDICFCAKCHR